MYVWACIFVFCVLSYNFLTESSSSFFFKKLLRLINNENLINRWNTISSSFREGFSFLSPNYPFNF